MAGGNFFIGIGKILFSLFPKKRLNKESIRKILIFKTGAMGDALMSTPFLRELRETFPEAHLEYWVGEWAELVLEGNKDIDKIVSFDASMCYEGRLFDVLGLIKQMRKAKFDISFVLDKDWKVNLLPLLAGVPVRVGFDRFGEGFPNTINVSYAKRQHEIQYYLDLVAAVGGKKSEDYHMTLAIEKKHEAFAKQFLRKHKLIGKKLIGIAPGGARNPGQEMASRRWPIERFFDLAMTLEKQGWKIILFGGKTDSAEIKMIQSNTSAVSALGASLHESTALMRYCKYFICNDSGPMHLAAAAGVPTISIFGPTDPIRKAPLGPKHRFLWKEVDCTMAELYGKYTAELEQNILNIEVEDVLEKIK